MINTITSKDNQKIKDLVKLRDDKKFRENLSLYYIEGERIIKDTNINLIESIFISESYKNNNAVLIENFPKEKLYIVSDEIYNKIKSTINSQGIIATVHSNLIKNINSDFLKDLKFILILDNIQDPGNLGTILRVAEASGVSLVILSFDCCDIYNPKVLRAAMSSISRMNIYISYNLQNDIIFLKDNNYKIYSSSINKNSKYYNKIIYNNKTVIIIGNEGNGIKEVNIKLSDECIGIPMKGEIESLNASIATGIICYEVSNQLYKNETQ